MTIDEINQRIHELEVDIELLNSIKQEYIDNGRDPIFIRAIDDGIRYTSMRLETYKTTNWIMAIE